MLLEAMTVHLPPNVIRRAEHVAKLTYRTLDKVFEDALSTAIPDSPQLPALIAAELAAMRDLSDAALWAASKPSMDAARLARLHQLNHAAGLQTLSQSEQAEQAELLMQQRMAALRCTRAMQLLTLRGHALPTTDELPLPTDWDDDEDSEISA